MDNNPLIEDALRKALAVIDPVSIFTHKDGDYFVLSDNAHLSAKAVWEARTAVEKALLEVIASD